MSAPTQQNGNGTAASSSQSQQPSTNGRQQRINRASTPQDNRGHTEGDSNGYNKPKFQGNPSFKKNWQQRNGIPEPGANGQEDQKRKGKERVNDQGVADAPTANGDRKAHRDNRRRETPRDSNQSPPTEQQPQQPPPQQQQSQQVVQPNVDRQRVEESKRINALITTTPQNEQLTPDQRKAIAKIKEVVQHVSDSDARLALEQNTWDVDRTVNYFTENPGASSWSDVVRKQRKEAQPEAPPVQAERTERPRKERPDRERTPRSREERNHQRANGELNQRYQQKAQPNQQAQQPQPPSPQHQQAQAQAQHPPQNAQPQHPPANPQAQHPHPHAQTQHQVQQQVQHQLHQHHLQQLQQQQYQQHLYQQQQYHLQQQQQQQVTAAQVPEAFTPADGEQLIMGFSKAIEVQLAEIAERSRLLLQMQTELANIHAVGKDQLTNLQEEKSQLISEKTRLQAQLHEIEERLGVIDVGIEKAEQEKLYKLKDWQRRSVQLGSLVASHLLTNH